MKRSAIEVPSLTVLSGDVSVMQFGLLRRVAAEAVGTAVLVLVGTGSVVAALSVGDAQLDYAGLGFIALAFAIVVAVVIYGLGPVSGAHINPAVTVALAMTGRFPWREVGAYVAAQCAGACAGSLLVVATYGQGAVDLGLGATALGEGVSYGQGIAAEAVGTFVLMFAVMAMAVAPHAPPGWAGLIIGLSVAAAILLIAPQTGGSLNPARTFGPNLTLALFGGGVAWGQLAVYCIGPLVGAAAAVLGYDALTRTRAAQETSAQAGSAAAGRQQS